MTRFRRPLAFRTILCPVDYSRQSRTALRYAEAIARQAKGRLAVLYVHDPLLIAAAAVALHDRTLAERSRAELRRFVDSTLSAGTRDTVPIDHVVSIGNPAKEIKKTAMRLRADLIVMGTHGLTGAKRLLLGSTTQGVLHRAVVPVLAIPGRASRLTGPRRTRFRAPVRPARAHTARTRSTPPTSGR